MYRGFMIIDCIGCLHGFYPDLRGGDLLIVSGDLTSKDNAVEYAEFVIWLQSQKYRNKVVIAGNHDNFIENNKGWAEIADLGFDYLCDSGIEVIYYRYLDPPNLKKIGIPYKQKTLKIWGSPWSSQFPGINPNTCAFTRPYNETLADRWDLIPDDVDILITHTPPYGVFDLVDDLEHVGNLDLRNHVIRRIKPKLHVFSHIHECGGNMVDTNVTKFVNCSIMNEHYKPVNKPVRVIL